MAVTMIPLQRRSDAVGTVVGARRRATVGLAAAALFMIVGLAARPHLAAPDVRPASPVGSSQINVNVDDPIADAPLADAALSLPQSSPLEAGAPVAVPAAVIAGGDAGAAGTVYTAQRGDTLWSVAVSHVPAAEVNAYLSTLVSLNGSNPIFAGEHLTLPG